MVPAGQSDWALKTDCVQLQSICSSLAYPPVRADLVMELARWLLSGSYCLWLASFLPSLSAFFPLLFPSVSLSFPSLVSFLSRSESLYPPKFYKYTRSLIPLFFNFFLYLFISLSLYLPFSGPPTLNYLLLLILFLPPFSFFLSGPRQLYASQLPTKGLSFSEARTPHLPVIPLGLLWKTQWSPSLARYIEWNLIGWSMWLICSTEGHRKTYWHITLQVQIRSTISCAKWPCDLYLFSTLSHPFLLFFFIFSVQMRQLYALQLFDKALFFQQ